MASSINIKYLIVICVLLWLGMVIVNIPAVWGAWLISQSGAVQLSQVSGSLWSGRAAEVVARVDRRSLPLGAMSWNLNPLSLLTLSPCAAVKLRAEGQSFEGDVCAGLGGVRLSDAAIDAPAAVLSPLLPTEISGRISARIETAEVDKSFNVTALSGNLLWEQASAHNGSEWMALGAYSADLSPDGKGGVKADVVDRGGPLQLKMEVLAKLANAGAALKGDVLLRKDAPAALQQSLPLIGDKKSNGSYAIEMTL